MRIGIVVFDDFTDVDVFLPWDLLNRVQRGDWQVRLIGESGQHRSRTGLVIPIHERIDYASGCDALVFASGPGTRVKIRDAAYLNSFRLDPSRQLIGAMCSGALLLAAMGLLTGKKATTHPVVRDQLAQFPVEVVDEPFVQVGNIATAGGCLAALLLSGWVIESLVGPAARAEVLASVQPVGESARYPAGISEGELRLVTVQRASAS